MGSAIAVRELGIFRNALYTWVKNVRDGGLDIGGVHKLLEPITLNGELIQACKHIKVRERKSIASKVKCLFVKSSKVF